MITGVEKCIHEAGMKGEGGKFVSNRRQIRGGVITVYKIVNNTENGGEELLRSFIMQEKMSS